MTNIQKQELKEQLSAYVARVGSQNKAAATLGVSSATVSQILNDNWEKIADEMWRKIAAQIGGKKDWQAVETVFYRAFTQLLDDAQQNSYVYAVTAEAGSGKTFTCKQYAANNANVLHIACCEAWSLQAFLREILRSLGMENRGNNNDNLSMLYTVIGALKKMERPLIILDEADKMRAQILYSLITLYNQLEDICGIVMCATPHLQQKIERGVEMQKLGYNELYSRFGRKFIEIPACGKADVARICTVNGIEGGDDHADIANQSDGDLRRVKRMVHAFKKRGQ